MINPKLSKSSIVAFTLLTHYCLDDETSSISSRYKIEKKPLLRKQFTIGFRTLVNIYGATLRPKGRHKNSKYWPWKINLRYFDEISSIGIKK